MDIVKAISNDTWRIKGLMAHSPAISVIMPLFNKEKYVERAVRSVLDQTFGNFELIVVNDGSTDRSIEVVEDIEDMRLRIIHQANSGVSVARNRGIAAAQTDLIAFLDADDEWTEDYLETILRLVGNFPDAAVFATGYMFKQSGSHEHRAIVRGLPTDFSEGLLENYFAVAAHSDPPLCSSAVTVRRKAIESVEGFPVGIHAGEDLLTWARLAARYQIAYSGYPKAFFYAPERMDDRPARHPQIPDRVAEGLLVLLNDPAAPEASKNGLTAYIGLWLRMRAVVFIKLNCGFEARKEISSAIHYSGLTPRLILLRILSWLPERYMADTFNALNSLRRSLRREKLTTMSESN